MYDHVTLDLRMLQLMYECSDIYTNSTIDVRKDASTFTLEGDNFKKLYVKQLY